MCSKVQVLTILVQITVYNVCVEPEEVMSNKFTSSVNPPPPITQRSIKGYKTLLIK